MNAQPRLRRSRVAAFNRVRVSGWLLAGLLSSLLAAIAFAPRAGDAQLALGVTGIAVLVAALP